MNLAVLSSQESWYLRDLIRAAGPRHRLRTVDFQRLNSAIHVGRPTRVFAGAIDLAEFDAALVRTMPAGSLEQIVFRMDTLAVLEAGGVPVINPPKALEAAVDKYLALARIASAGLSTPRTINCQSHEDAERGFHELGGDVVLKPLFGAEGRGITRITDIELAGRAFRLLEQLGSSIYLQEFVPHEGFDVRVLLIGDDAFAIRRNSSDWRTNVSRGGSAEPFKLTDELESLARRASNSVGATLAGVDLLPRRDGAWLVLEVNAVPGWRALSQALDVDIAALVLDYCEAVVGQRGSP